MRIPALTCCFALFTSSLAVHADQLIQPNDTLAICGDSITAEHLYSAYMEDYLLMCSPTDGLNIVQFGWGGEQAPGFLARLDSDVFPYKPTIATSTYGMNDGHYAALTDDTANTYRKAQTDIAEAFKKNGVRTYVLGSPKCVDSYFYHRDPAAPAGTNQQATIYNATLSSLADIDKDIVSKEGLVYADVFGITLDTMKKAKAEYGDDYVFAGGDGVHPGPNGSLVMAYAFLKALGNTGDIATITVDMASNNATSTKGQDVESCKDGVVTLKSTRYPFCFSGTIGDKQDGNTAGVIKFFPFNQDLNRYILIVKGLKSAKAKVTWGGETHEYTADDLAKGVNLAADFMNNPFRDQFFRVHQAIQMQQQEEMIVMQGSTHDAQNYKNVAPSASAALDQWIESGKSFRAALFKNAGSLVIPIEHTIKIEPST
jgi:lysophospholipase L1-like esterase